MNKRDRDIPPGHTKPPIRHPETEQKDTWVWPSLLKLPRAALLVLVFAALGSVAFVLIDPEPLSGVAMVAVISVGAFAEARREDAGDRPSGLWAMYERGLEHAVWVAATVWPVTMLAIWLRNLIGLYPEAGQ